MIRLLADRPWQVREGERERPKALVGLRGPLEALPFICLPAHVLSISSLESPSRPPIACFTGDLHVQQILWKTLIISRRPKKQLQVNMKSGVPSALSERDGEMTGWRRGGSRDSLENDNFVRTMSSL